MVLRVNFETPHVPSDTQVSDTGVVPAPLGITLLFLHVGLMVIIINYNNKKSN